MMTWRRIGRRITGQNMGTFIVKIQTRRIDDHSIRGEIAFTIVNQAELAAYRLTVIAQSEQSQCIVRPRAGRNRDRPAAQFE